MKIVIEIPRIMYGAIKQYGITFLSSQDKKTLRKSITNGTPLDDIKAKIDKQSEIHSDGEFYITNFEVHRILYADGGEA